MNLLVTGGSSGLGKAIVCALADSPDHRIFFTYNRHGEEAESMAQEHPNVVAHPCDFTKEDDLRALEEAIPSFDLDVLINNAYVGTPQGTHFHKTPPEHFAESFAKNVLPLIRITQGAVVGFRKKKFGKIINVLTAALANVPPMGYSVYAANKAYILQLSKSWSYEYAKYNITSNCVSPDFMLTNLSADVDERVVQQVQDRHPFKKLLTPAEVAETVLYLTNASQQVNGTHVIINAAQNIM